MSLRYRHLLSPVRVNNLILRNRMVSTASTPHFLQGTEPYPTEKLITHFANRAKNGAAVVTINHLHNDTMPFWGRAIDNPPCHFNMLEMDEPIAQNYICQLIDAIHFYGAKANAYIMAPAAFRLGGPPPMGEEGPGGMDMPDGPMEPDYTMMTRNEMDAFIADYAQQALDLKRLGFDIVSIYSCYRRSPQAQFLSPQTNHRTDEYGGSLENRARFMLELFSGIRKAVGPDFAIECVLSVSEPEGGYTVEDTIELARMAEGLIDILHLRAGEMDPQHPLGFTSTEDMPTPFLEEMGKVTRAVHEMGLKMVVGASAGFQNLDWANKAVAEGKADLICMARSWINNPDYGLKAYEGRGEDVVPCIRCNKCHVSNARDMFRSVCSVNPVLGLEDKIERMIQPPRASRKVAVVGGGPAGLEFAKVAAERGHKVTLYESSGTLGGMLKHAQYPSFKWPLRQFRDFMISQMDKKGVKVILNTKATRELLEKEGYDVVAVAIGAEPVAPPIPGVDRDNVRFAADIYGREDSVGSSVAIIGGGEIGVETGLYLAELGRKVTVLEMLPELIMDAPHAHYKNMVQDYWRKQPNFSYRCSVKCTSIEPDGVRYTDSEGSEYKVFCDTVLLAVGTRAKTEEAMALHGAAPYTVVIGDCEKAGNVQKAMRSAFAAASLI
ncbi:MAG: FAD-dependent oxidoreductase [Oscillospiraceae bacterium]|jgi:2,4-dienoyl-CoA reductase-like NADH-dependent reductase (Old Yellow Enzyme family)/NADPH-dependent 2,4-dienoyl-CoA reductase/sulfur reductase-like enzyme